MKKTLFRKSFFTVFYVRSFSFPIFIFSNG